MTFLVLTDPHLLVREGPPKPRIQGKNILDRGLGHVGRSLDGKIPNYFFERHRG